MNRKEILEKVTAINEELLQKGYSFKGIETFWNECFEEARKKMPIHSDLAPLSGVEFCKKSTEAFKDMSVELGKFAKKHNFR